MEAYLQQVLFENMFCLYKDLSKNSISLRQVGFRRSFSIDEICMSKFKYQLFFANPNKSPKNNMPRVLCESESLDEIKKLCCWAKMIDFGYSIGICLETPEPKKLPPSTLAKIRIKKLQKSLKERLGLFYEILYEEEFKKELARKPWYYEGKTLNSQYDSKEKQPKEEVMSTNQCRQYLLHRMPFISNEINRYLKINRKLFQH